MIVILVKIRLENELHDKRIKDLIFIEKDKVKHAETIRD